MLNIVVRVASTVRCLIQIEPLDKLLIDLYFDRLATVLFRLLFEHSIITKLVFEKLVYLWVIGLYITCLLRYKSLITKRCEILMNTTAV